MTGDDEAELQGHFREVMAGVAPPVSVVTAIARGLPHGTTVSAFASLSMDPPMVLVALGRQVPGGALGNSTTACHASPGPRAGWRASSPIWWTAVTTSSPSAGWWPRRPGTASRSPTTPPFGTHSALEEVTW